MGVIVPGRAVGRHIQSDPDILCLPRSDLSNVIMPEGC